MKEGNIPLKITFSNDVPSLERFISSINQETGLKVCLTDLEQPPKQKMTSAEVADLFYQLIGKKVRIDNDFDAEMIISGYISFSGFRNTQHFILYEHGYFLGRSHIDSFLKWKLVSILEKLGGVNTSPVASPNWISLEWDDPDIPEEVRLEPENL